MDAQVPGRRIGKMLHNESVVHRHNSIVMLVPIFVSTTIIDT